MRVRTGRPNGEGWGACVSAILVQDNVDTLTFPEHINRPHVRQRDMCSAGDAECDSHKPECGEP